MGLRFVVQRNEYAYLLKDDFGNISCMHLDNIGVLCMYGEERGLEDV